MAPSSLAGLARIREYWFGDGGGGGASPIRSARSAELQLEQWLDSEDGSALTPMVVVVPPAPAAEEKDKENGNDNDDDDDDDDDEHASAPLWANSHDAIAMVMSAMEAKDTRARELLEQLECVRHKLSVESQQRWAQLDELQKQRATEREVKASLDASKDENRRLREHVVEMRRSVQSALLAKSALQMRLEEAEQKQMRVLHDESERKKDHGLAAAASSHHHHRQVAPPPLPSQLQQTFSHPGNNNNTTSSSITTAETAMLEEEDEDEREGGGGEEEEEASPSSPVKVVADEAAAAVTIRDRNVETTTTTSSRKSRKAKRHARSIALDDDK